jgi:hypothetical protein
MKTFSLNRRKFISSSVALLALSACKKDAVLNPKTGTGSSIPTDSPPIVHDNPEPDASYLGQFGVTEVGRETVVLPKYFELLTYGYTNSVSYFPGDTVDLFLTGPKNLSKKILLIDALDTVVYSFSVSVDRQQIKSLKPWKDGFMFDKTATFTLPSNLKSGVYKIATGPNKHERITIVCKNRSQNPDFTVIYPSNTDNAYNRGGGKSLYLPTNSRSTVASFMRYSMFPSDTTSGFNKWATTQSYDANFIADSDLEDYNNIQNSKLLIIIGHSEYWTRKARLNVDKFVKSGKNLLVLSGNTMWWQVRYSKNRDLMICAKDATLDPLGGTPYSCIHWYEPALDYQIYSSIGVDWNRGGFANKMPNRWDGFKITNSNSPLLEGTNLKNGDTLKLPSVEVDGAPTLKSVLPGSTEIPVIDNKVLNFKKVELLGYDLATGGPNKNGLSTFIVFQKDSTSGTVVNVATMNWCSPTGMDGDDAVKLRTITKNMIDKSLKSASLFTAQHV